MVFNDTFNNISGISCQVSFIGGENRRKTLTYHKSLQTLSHKVVSSTPALAGFELTPLVMIGTDCIGSCKSYYHGQFIFDLTTIKIILFCDLCKLFNHYLTELY